MEKKGLHPTCHTLSLTLMTKLVAFFDMAFGLFGLVWFVIMLSRYNIISLDPFENASGSNNGTSVSLHPTPVDSKASDRHHALQQEYAISQKVIGLSLVAFYTTVNLSVFVLLLVGVYKRSPGICMIWFYIRCAIFVFKLIILFMYLIGGRPIYHHVPFICSMVVHLYGLWVVNCYVDELKGGGGGDEKQEIQYNESTSTVAGESDLFQKNDDDVPNGIEAVLRSRILEAQAEKDKKSENII